jgi:hypothetical protein
MYQVTWVAIRPDNTVPFFHHSPEAAEYIATLDYIRENRKDLFIENIREFNDDMSRWVNIWKFENRSKWLQTLTVIRERHPTTVEGVRSDWELARDAYFEEHEHILIFKIEEDGQEITVQRMC